MRTIYIQSYELTLCVAKVGRDKDINLSRKRRWKEEKDEKQKSEKCGKAIKKHFLLIISTVPSHVFIGSTNQNGGKKFALSIEFQRAALPYLLLFAETCQLQLFFPKSVYGGKKTYSKDKKSRKTIFFSRVRYLRKSRFMDFDIKGIALRVLNILISFRVLIKLYVFGT